MKYARGPLLIFHLSKFQLARQARNEARAGLLMGRPYVIPWCADNVSAIIAAYYPGTRGGEAIADVLFGDYNPTGKLPFQMPRSMEQVKNLREDVPFDIEEPLYPYGYGLSY